VKTPAKASCMSLAGVGGVGGCLSGGVNFRCFPLGSPGVGGRLDADFRDVEGEVGEGGEPIEKAGGSVWPLMLNRSTPVVGLPSSAV
jgi:hypothetical protein